MMLICFMLKYITTLQVDVSGAQCYVDQSNVIGGEWVGNDINSDFTRVSESKNPRLSFFTNNV